MDGAAKTAVSPYQNRKRRLPAEPHLGILLKQNSRILFQVEFSFTNADCPPMVDGSEFKRLAFSPGEFAALFGKSQTWGYRQIYNGNVVAITEYGRRLIPASEAERILKTAGVFNGLKPKSAKTKAEIQKLAPRLQNAWQSFLAARRNSAPAPKTPRLGAASKAKWPAAPAARRNALARLIKSASSRP